MPYRAQASLRIGPATLQQLDPTRSKQRLKDISALGTSALLAAQQRAAERKAEAEFVRKQKFQEAQAAIQQRIADRAKQSQVKTQQAQTDTVNQYQRMNARLQQQQQERQKLGASQYTNPNFRGGDGRLVAVGGQASKVAAGIINEALRYRGRMYQWGGSTPKTSFDCSGLVQWAYKSMGVALPRVSADQARSGRKIPLQALRPGDLVAWDNSSRNMGADHIAIYIGNGQIIEAPRTGQAIRVRALGNEQNAWGVQILK